MNMYVEHSFYYKKAGVLHKKNIQKVILPQKVILLSYILLVKKVT